MKILVLGAGWVGLTSAAAFAHLGHHVICADIQAARIEKLQRGEVPFFEPGLNEYLHNGVASAHITFTAQVEAAFAQAHVVFCCVGTPPQLDGSANIQDVLTAAQQFGALAPEGSLFVVKSTVPPGTSQECAELIAQGFTTRGLEVKNFAVASNPEFLAEGTAMKDTLEPERIILGCDDAKFCNLLKEVYAPLVANGVPLLAVGVSTAEMIKYAANTFLASKISFMNEIANFCDLVGADPLDVAKGMGLDSRIGPKFLRPGVGYGGSCFPKDVRALIATGKKHGYDFRLLPQVDAVNQAQRERLYTKLENHLGGVAGKRIAIWGLSYKPKTDDIRESPALYFIERLQKEGAEVRATDPRAHEAMQRVFPSLATFNDPCEAAQEADAVVVLTEWPEFTAVPLAKLKTVMRGSVLADGRRIWKAGEVQAQGFTHIV